MNRTVAFSTLALAAAGQYWLGVQPWAPLPWLAAVALFVLLLRDPEQRRFPAVEPPLATSIETAALLAILAAGIFLRTYRLDLIPSGLNHDVAWNGLYALRILRGEPYTPYTAEAWGRETTMFYLQALGIRLWGVETPALIYPAVAVGIALLPFFYLWLRELFGPRLALAATFLLAVSGWHLVFSRIGWRAVLQPLVSTIAYYFFARAVRTRGTLAFCAAGAAAAAAVYTYNAARPLPALFPLFALYALALAPDRRGAVERYRSTALDMAVPFALVVSPMAYYAATHWWAWEQRASATFFLDGQTGWEHLAAVVKVYLLTANGDDFFVTTPVLEWPVAVLFVFGFLWCLAQPRDLRAVFLLLGWLVATAPAFLSTPNANRMIGTLPFTDAFAALGALFFLRALVGRAVPGPPLTAEPAGVTSDVGPRAQTERGGPGTARPTPIVVAAAFVAVVGVAATAATWLQYFGADRRELPGFYPDATILARYARSLLPRYDVWIGGKNFPRETLDYLTYQGGDPRQRAYTWLDDVSLAPSMEIVPGEGKGAALILASEGRSGLTFEQLRRRYPQAEIVELKDWTRDDEVFARALLLTPETLAAAPPAREAQPLPEVYLRDAGRGSGPGQLLDPHGVAAGPDGRVYVTDTGNHRVQVFAAGGRLTSLFGEKGATPGTFDEPSAIALDSEGKLHVVDTWNHRVQKLEPNGFPLAYYVPPQGFYGPRGIAIAGGKVFVTDTGNHSIAIFETDGLYAGSLGMGEGSQPGQLESPIGIAVAADERVWVVDSGNHRLQVFEQNGDLVRVIPVPGWSGTDLREGYLAADGDGVILSDPPAGKLWSVTRDGHFDALAQRLRFPGGVALGPAGVYVAERDAGRITVIPR